MAYVCVGIIPDHTKDDEAVSPGLGSEPVHGLIAHYVGEQDSGGVVIVDVWESRDVAAAFYKQRLLPALAASNVATPRTGEQVFAFDA